MAKSAGNIRSPAIKTKPLIHAECGGHLLRQGRGRNPKLKCDRCDGIVDVGYTEHAAGQGIKPLASRRNTLEEVREAIHPSEWVPLKRR